MIDLAILQGTVTGLKTAFDIAKGMAELKTMSEVQSKVIELQQVILSAQSSAMAANAEQYAAAEELRKLKEEFERSKKWQAESARYKLVRTGDAGLVMGYPQSKALEGEPAHFLCAHCFDNGKKAMLNNSPDKDRWTVWLCPSCKTQVPTSYRGAVPAGFAPESIDAPVNASSS